MEERSEHMMLTVVVRKEKCVGGVITRFRVPMIKNKSLTERERDNAKELNIYSCPVKITPSKTK